MLSGSLGSSDEGVRRWNVRFRIGLCRGQFHLSSSSRADTRIMKDLLHRQTLLPHKKEQTRQNTCRRQSENTHERRTDETQDPGGMEEMAPSLFVHSSG